MLLYSTPSRARSNGRGRSEPQLPRKLGSIGKKCSGGWRAEAEALQRRMKNGKVSRHPIKVSVVSQIPE